MCTNTYIGPLHVLVFGCCELSHVIFLMLRKKELLAMLSKFTKQNCIVPYTEIKLTTTTNDNHFHSKRQPRTILSENSCHFVNLLSFASSSFFLSLKKNHVTQLATAKNQRTCRAPWSRSLRNDLFFCLFYHLSIFEWTFRSHF